MSVITLKAWNPD